MKNANDQNFFNFVGGGALTKGNTVIAGKINIIKRFFTASQIKNISHKILVLFLSDWNLWEILKGMIKRKSKF